MVVVFFWFGVYDDFSVKVVFFYEFLIKGCVFFVGDYNEFFNIVFLEQFYCFVQNFFFGYFDKFFGFFIYFCFEVSCQDYCFFWNYGYYFFNGFF